MGAGLGLLIILIAIIRHFGACAREASYESHSKQDAIAKGQTTYMTFNGGRKNVSDGHRVHEGYSQYVGAYRYDTVSKKVYYDGLEKFIKEYNETEIDTSKGTAYEGFIPGVKNRIYVDYKTGELMYAAKFYGVKLGSKKTITEFYTDLKTRTKVIRKTDKQLREEKNWPQWEYYTLDEIKANKHGEYHFNEEYQRWTLDNTIDWTNNPFGIPMF